MCFQLGFRVLKGDDCSGFDSGFAGGRVIAQLYSLSAWSFYYVIEMTSGKTERFAREFLRVV